MRKPLLQSLALATLLFVATFAAVFTQGCGRSDLLGALADAGTVPPATCSVESCPSGCCDAKTGACRVGTDVAACGGFGTTCQDCAAQGRDTCDEGSQSCGTKLAVCDATTCATGCCVGNTCVVGDQDAACGTGGKSCTSCADAGNKCDATSRSCGGATCNASTCPGCCVGNSCVGGTQNTTCGAGGAECTDCSATGQTCGSDNRCAGTASCNATNCAGCCIGDRCVTGGDVTACGRGGAACSTCGTGSSCTGGICVIAPVCNAMTCPTGCCLADGRCAAGNQDAACGTAGATCATCTTTGRVCTGNACVTPTCGPGNCAGCCQGNTCVGGTADSACGRNGAACTSCSTSQSCSAMGACQASCTAANCPGCCTGTTCNLGYLNNQCGSGAATCANCSGTTAGSTCDITATPRVCKVPAANCPIAYPGCAAAVTTTAKTQHTNTCSVADLANARAACTGTNGFSSAACKMFIADLARVSPACQACLAPFEVDPNVSPAGIFTCLAPFVSVACNHNTGCATDCQGTTCNQCPVSQTSSCQSSVQTNQCRPQFTQAAACVTVPLLGTGAVCNLASATYRGDFGAWLQGVGRQYCGP